MARTNALVFIETSSCDRNTLAMLIRPRARHPSPSATGRQLDKWPNQGRRAEGRVPVGIRRHFGPSVAPEPGDRIAVAIFRQAGRKAPRDLLHPGSWRGAMRRAGTDPV